MRPKRKKFSNKKTPTKSLLTNFSGSGWFFFPAYNLLGMNCSSDLSFFAFSIFTNRVRFVIRKFGWKTAGALCLMTQLQEYTLYFVCTYFYSLPDRPPCFFLKNTNKFSSFLKFILNKNKKILFVPTIKRNKKYFLNHFFSTDKSVIIL